MFFPVANIEINPLIPILTGLAVSVVSAPTGVSGGFLIMPVYLNFLNFTSASVSPTNFIFNVVAMPPGLWRLHREKRLMWGLGGLLTLGCLPGIFAGTVLRCTWLRQAADFKVFVGLVLFCLALSLFHGLWKGNAAADRAERNFLAHKSAAGLRCAYSRRNIAYDFSGEHFIVSTPQILLVSLLVGIIGGIYGIGGAAMIAPILVGFFKMPIYVVNGASLLAGWAGAVFGLFSYAVFWPAISGEPPIYPDIKLGLLFGLGGMLGVYAGSAMQRFLPPKPLKMMMLALICLAAVQNFGLF